MFITLCIFFGRIKAVYAAKTALDSVKTNIEALFEDKIWLLFAGMGFNGLNEENGIEIAYDFNDDSLKERISVVAVDEETILIVLCYASENIVLIGGATLS